MVRGGESPRVPPPIRAIRDLGGPPMASSNRADLPPKQWKILAMMSGNRCAFPQCERFLAIPGEAGSPDVVLGQAAHIIGASRRGPRGDFDISDLDRDRLAVNRILFCPDHHILVDTRPNTYTIQVLRKMKRGPRATLPPAGQAVRGHLGTGLGDTARVVPSGRSASLGRDVAAAQGSRDERALRRARRPMASGP
jgi:hypothetical protein